MSLRVPTLQGSSVRLEPLSVRHAADLADAVEEDRSSYGFALVPRADGVPAYLEAQLARQAEGLTPVAQVRVRDHKAVGCTAIWNPRTWPGRPELRAIEVGGSWLAASAQGTGINVEAKFLLFSYVFETLGVVRVDLKTDARNKRAHLAVERLGARYEGVLRQWPPSRAPGEEGQLRDSAMFSVIASEWPATKLAMLARLAPKHHRGRAGSR